MSHAAVIVAPSLEQINRMGTENAVAWEMEPFQEESWFEDGSRWDWYQVGGRFTGLLTGYDPYTDPANQETCEICAGSGIRPGGKEQFGEEWFKGCNGCNGCHGTGKRVAYRLQKHCGDILQVKRLDLEQLKAANRADYTKTFERAMKEQADHREFLYDVKVGETLQDYLTRKVENVALSAAAFLRNRHWHEAERMGWFGGSTYTECERKDMDKVRANPDAWFGKCLHKDEKTGAQIVCWNEPNELWSELYHRRFIQPLHPEDTLVVVDYHV